MTNTPSGRGIGPVAPAREGIELNLEWRPPTRGTDAPYRHEIALNPRARSVQSVVLVHVRRLLAEDVSLVATIDRSEHVDVQYRVIDGELQQIPATITEVAAWDPTGSGSHSVTAEIAFCESVVARRDPSRRLRWRANGRSRDRPPGVRAAPRVVGVPPRLSALPQKRCGAGSLERRRRHRRGQRAESIYVSATPTASAVGFYLRQGCRLAQPCSSRSVRRGARRHSSRSITEVTTERRSCAGPRLPEDRTAPCTLLWRAMKPPGHGVKGAGS